MVRSAGSCRRSWLSEGGCSWMCEVAGCRKLRQVTVGLLMVRYSGLWEAASMHSHSQSRRALTRLTAHTDQIGDSDSFLVKDSSKRGSALLTLTGRAESL